MELMKDHTQASENICQSAKLADRWTDQEIQHLDEGEPGVGLAIVGFVVLTGALILLFWFCATLLDSLRH